MKKTLLTILLLLPLGIIVAQNWSAGPRLGINFSNITNCASDYAAGINVGLFGEYKIRNFAIEADLLYSTQGMKSPNFKDKTNDKFLQVPLKFKLYMPYILSGLNIFAGPQLDACLENNSIFIDGSGDKNPYRDITASITTGIGYRFKCGLDLTMNYNAGIVSRLKADNRNLMNSVFQISVGWDLFCLLKK